MDRMKRHAKIGQPATKPDGWTRKLPSVVKKRAGHRAKPLLRQLFETFPALVLLEALKHKSKGLSRSELLDLFGSVSKEDAERWLSNGLADLRKAKVKLRRTGRGAKMIYKLDRPRARPRPRPRVAKSRAKRKSSR